MKYQKVCYIIGTYPDFSTTFIDREIKMMREWGLNNTLLAMRRPVLRQALSQQQQQLEQEVTYLLPVQWLIFFGAHIQFVLTRPVVFFTTLFYLFLSPHPTLKSRLMTLLHFAEGVYAAHFLKQQAVTHLHAHFVERAATVTLVAARLLNITYSLAIHAGADIFSQPVLLPQKFKEAKFIVSCTQYNLTHLQQQGFLTAAHRSYAIHHGIEPEHYPIVANPLTPPLILTVGRLVEKKGFEYLIQACRILKDNGTAVQCHIIGPGPQRPILESLIKELSLEDVVVLRGSLPHDEVMIEYRHATLFALPCIRSRDGDLDGIPNVLAEAMSSQLPVVSTTVSAIPELVEHNKTGLLVAPNDAQQLADAIIQLLDDCDLRRQMGIAGRHRVEEVFNLKENVYAIYQLFNALNN